MTARHWPQSCQQRPRLPDSPQRGQFVALHSQEQRAVAFLEKHCSVVTEVWSVFPSFLLKAERCSTPRVSWVVVKFFSMTK